MIRKCRWRIAVGERDIFRTEVKSGSLRIYASVIPKREYAGKIPVSNYDLKRGSTIAEDN